MPDGEKLGGRSQFVLSAVGRCSFCGKCDGEASGFAGVALRPHRICAQCLGLCLEVTCEIDKHEERSALAAQLASLDPQRELYQRLEPDFMSGNVDGVVEGLREFGHGDVDRDIVRNLMSSLPSDSCVNGSLIPSRSDGRGRSAG